jgi:hypothetical protein
MQRQIEVFVASLNEELSQHTRPQPVSSNSLVPVSRSAGIVPVAAAAPKPRKRKA